MFIGFTPWDVFRKHCEEVHDIACGNIGFCEITFCEEQNKKEHMKICHQLNKLLLTNVDGMTISGYKSFEPFDYRYRHYSNDDIIDVPDDCFFVRCSKCESGSECHAACDLDFATYHAQEIHPYWCSFCNHYFVNALDRIKHKCSSIKDGQTYVQQQMHGKKRKSKSSNDNHNKDTNVTTAKGNADKMEIS